MDELVRILSESEPYSAPLPNISSDQIQKCLEENSHLIQMIMDSQRLGRFDVREILTDQLQRNLTILTKLADVMLPPPPPPPPPQMMTTGPQVNVSWNARQPQAEVINSDPRYLPDTPFGAPFENSGFTHNFFAP